MEKTRFNLLLCQVLIELDVEGFDVLEFFNQWTGMLTPLVR